MPTIVMASPKGGAGKSTSALLLTTELAAAESTVTLIDADPNRPLLVATSRLLARAQTQSHRAKRRHR